MLPDGSRVPRTSAELNNVIDSDSQNHNYGVYEAHSDNQDASSYRNNMSNLSVGGPRLANQTLAPNAQHSAGETLPLMSAGIPTYTNWAVVQQPTLLFQGLSASTIDNGPPANGSFPAGGWVAPGFDNQGWGNQHSPSSQLAAATPASWGYYSPELTQYSSPSSTNSVSSNAQRYHCPWCPNISCNSRKDLQRHLETSRAHCDDGTRVYWCCCGRTQARKDNHLRHVRSCNAPPQNPYMCKCGWWFSSRTEHEEHVRPCGRVRHPRQPTIE